MIEKLLIRPYQTGDEEDIVSLLHLVYNGWPQFDVECSPAEHWKWKFKDNPTKSTISSLGVVDEKIIGCTHRIPRRIKIGNKVFLGGSGADAAVHPNFRNIGVLRQMDKLIAEMEAKSKIELFYAVSSNPIMIKCYSTEEKNFIHSVFTFIRIKDLKVHFQTMPKKNATLYRNGFQLAKIYNRLKNVFSRTSQTIQDFHISQFHNFDKRTDSFWNEIKNHYVFIVERTKDYLNWRYCDSRGGNYIVRAAEKDGQILGYVILRINRWRKEYPTGYIVDLIALPKRPDVAHALIENAIQEFDKENVNMIRCQIVKDHPYEKIFQRHGFLNSRIRTHIFCAPNASLSQEVQEALQNSASKIHFAYGDYDDI